MVYKYLDCGSKKQTSHTLLTIGICFLYNLDDIGSTSQLSFLVDEDWPGQHLAWVYERMLKEDSLPEPGHVLVVYKFTSWILVVFSVTMPIFFILADFTSGSA